MAARAGARTVPPVTRDPGPAGVMDSAPHVYGAALAASGDEGAAASVAEHVLRSALGEPAGGVVDRRLLVERAIRLGVRSAPAGSFAGMEASDREAIALARLGGYSVDEVAASLATSPEDVKSRMLRGLRSAARPRPVTRGSGPRKPPPPRDSGSGASRARGERGS